MTYHQIFVIPKKIKRGKQYHNVIFVKELFWGGKNYTKHSKKKKKKNPRNPQSKCNLKDFLFII